MEFLVGLEYVLLATEIILVGYIVHLVIRFCLMVAYFRSPGFLHGKARYAPLIAAHNDMAAHVAEVRARGVFHLGGSSSGAHAHLAELERRGRRGGGRHRARYRFANVHNCSLYIVRSAKAEPIKYLMKYFNIGADERTLMRVEQLGFSIAQLEDAVNNLHAYENEIIRSMRPPRFIRKHFMDLFLDRIGASFSPITVPYPIYIFEYVSAGGNSSQRTTIRLDTRTIDALTMTISYQIRRRTSISGQRALMTARLRESIKQRDGYTCRQCGLSLRDEPHLLLEIDHIIPVSKGGLTEPSNLQTLCWRCNRSKSNRIIRM